MLNDPIIAEIHYNRKEIWNECNGKIIEFIKLNKEKSEEYKKQGWKIVTKEDLENRELIENK